MIAAIAVAVIVGGWFLLTARTSDAGSTSDAPPAAVVPTDAPPSISELAAQGGAVDAADKFAAGPTAAPESTVPAVAATLPEMAAVLTTAPEPTVPTIPTATVPEPTVPAGPRVEIVTRTEPCKFGSNCLVAGFVLHDFATPPGEFVCEFASGNRFTFGAGQFAVERACATGARGDSITIEVAGIRSDTVTHD